MTTRQTVTLESAAGRLLRCADDCMQRFPMQVAVEIANEIRAEAALCRSAQAVIEAATPLLTAGDWTQLEYAAIARVRLALAAHARIENGHD